MRLAAGVLGLLLVSGQAWAASGADLFEDQCAMCHQPSGGQGPNLAGVVGRKAGSAPGFAYTPALKKSGIVWTPANLERFLTNPQAMVPGTAMPARINDPAERAAVVKHLGTLK